MLRAGRRNVALLSVLSGAAAWLSFSTATHAEILPPGNRPLPPGVHTIKAARVIPHPGAVITNGIVLIRDGRIEAVGEAVAIPADARIWELTNATVYPGFVDIQVPLSSKAIDSSSAEIIVNQQENLTAGSIKFFGVPGDERDPGETGPGDELGVVRSEFRTADKLSPSDKELESLRGLGFTAANFVPDKGVLRGASAFALLGDMSPNRAILRDNVFQHTVFDVNASASRSTYPRSLMGVIAVIRQTFMDAQFYDELASENPPRRNPVLGFNESLEALRPAVHRKQPVVLEPGSALMESRAASLADEFKLDYLLVACGQEWRRPDLIKATGARFIVPVDFPELPKLPEESDWDQVSLDELRTWDWAAENPAILRSNKLDIALTTFGLIDRKDFRKKLRKALDRGLTESDALQALTVEPATWCGLADQLGTIEPGKLANLTVVDGSYFDPEAKMDSVWIEGRHYSLIDPTDKSDDEKKEPKKADEPPAARAADSPMFGRGPLSPSQFVLFQHATIWTCGPQGILTNAELLVGADGKVTAVGHDVMRNLRLSSEPFVVDATGLHITPGLIDCHNHSFILGAVNEATLPSTAMVRIGDVVNSETPLIYEQLAGGLTTANLLHGSANPIGGQNQVVKLRWGASPEGMKFAGAMPGIKFALGENVKQSNRRPPNTRFPQSRMGVPVFMANRLTAAREYLAAWQKFNAGTGPKPRRDLELESLGEILEGKRLIHCHSYRQDEILAFLRTMESFGVKVGTLQHILEGYKVADEIAAHGAGASAFADWWAYKYEVRDAIPYDGAIMYERGVLVSYNSDSADFARRLNREAAKAVKYGGVPEAEALKFVTLNPAKQLHIDQTVGSLEAGKDADLAVWSGHPFAPQTACVQTWIDGRVYFDRRFEPDKVQWLHLEREALLAKAKKTADKKKKEPATDAKKEEAIRRQFFHEALEVSHEYDYSCSDNE